MTRQRSHIDPSRGTALFPALAFLFLLRPFARMSATTTGCLGPRTPCGKYANASRVFVGTVVAARADSPIVVRRNLRANLKILKQYKGAPLTEAVIVGDYPFESGRTYLVFADSLMRTSWCIGTEQYSEHSMNTMFLEGLPGSLDRRSIWGTVTRETECFVLRPKVAPVPGVTVRSTGRSFSFEAVTDSVGQFVFPDLPADSYRVEIDPPKGYMNPWDWCPASADLNTQSCDVVEISLIPDGRVIGRVVDAAGAPIPRIFVEAAPVDPGIDVRLYSGDLTSRTDDQGNYCIRGIPPGSYHVGSNLTDPPTGNQPYDATYYPGVRSKTIAAPVDIAPGEHKDPLNFSIDRTYPVVALRGVVRYSNGWAARYAHVDFCDSATYGPPSRRLSYANADSLGRFTLPILSGQPGWILGYAAPHNDPFMSGYKTEPLAPVFIEPAAIDGPLTLTIAVARKQ